MVFHGLVDIIIGSTMLNDAYKAKELYNLCEKIKNVIEECGFKWHKLSSILFELLL